MSSTEKQSETHVCELPLKVDPGQERKLLVRLDAGRQLYNACLSEGLRRVRLMWESKDWRAATKTRTAAGKKAFRRLEARFGFREYDLHAFCALTKNACSIGDHLDSNTCQKIASRAFAAVRQYAFGKRGKPRFKGVRHFDSVEGKTNKQGIRWVDGRVIWAGLELPALLDPKDRDGVQAFSLSRKVKYVRIVRRKLAGRNRFYAQLVLDGPAHLKRAPVSGTWGSTSDPPRLRLSRHMRPFYALFARNLNRCTARSADLSDGLTDRSARVTRRLFGQTAHIFLVAG